jgi:hypothetical protein
MAWLQDAVIKLALPYSYNSGAASTGSHNLDPTLVKAYAADFCGTPSLKEANRDLVQSFISHLAACAKEDKDMLICRLNSYAQPAEAKP